MSSKLCLNFGIIDPYTLFLRSIILISMAEKVLLLGDQGSSILSFIRDYLESRISLLKSFKVSFSMSRSFGN